MDLFDHWLENYVSTTVEIDPANPSAWWGKTLEEIRQCTEDPFSPTAPATSSAEAEATSNYYTDAESDHGANNAQSTTDAELESLAAADVDPQCLCDGQCSRFLENLNRANAQTPHRIPPTFISIELC